MSLEGKAALVTGAASGIGRAVAAELSDRGMYLVGLDVQREPNDDGLAFSDVADGELVVGDVTDPDEVQAAVTIARETGPLRVAVNSAGISSVGVSIDELTPADWRRAFAVHVDGTYNVCRSVLPPMREQTAGSVVNISSQFGLRGYHNRPEYAAAKGAVANLTRQLAVDFSPHSVRVNAVAPGFIKTGMTADTWRSDGERTSLDSIRKRTLLPRLGEPADVANLIGFLASDDAGFITGEVISVDGGWTAW